MSSSTVKDLPLAATFSLPNDAQKCRELLSTIKTNETYNTNMIQESKTKLAKYSQAKTSTLAQLANVKEEITRLRTSLIAIETEFKTKTDNLAPINAKVVHYTEQIKRANVRLQNCADLKKRIDAKISSLVKAAPPSKATQPKMVLQRQPVFQDAISDDDDN